MPLSTETDPRAEHLPRPANPTQSFLTKCYLAFIVLGGDAEKTAVACNVHPDFIKEYAANEDWRSRLESTANLCSAGGRGPAEIERLINRASLYVQAQRIRRVIDALLTEIEATPEAGLLERFTVHTKDGSRVDLKPIADITTAALKLMQMAQSVLSDTATERSQRAKTDARAGEDSILMGAEVLKGLSNIPANAPDSEAVATETVKQARKAVEARAKG